MKKLTLLLILLLITLTSCSTSGTKLDNLIPITSETINSVQSSAGRIVNYARSLSEEECKEFFDIVNVEYDYYLKDTEKLIGDYTPLFYITYKSENEYDSFTIYYLNNKKILITGCTQYIDKQYISTSAVLIPSKFLN